MRIILALGAASLALTAACAEPDEAAVNSRKDRVTVAVALFPVAEVVRAVGGESVSVVDLTPPGVEPHDVELAPSDVDTVQDVDVVVLIGGGFQPAVERAARRGEGAIVTLLPQGERDPHVWLDPKQMGVAARKVSTALGEVHVSEQEAFERRAARFAQEMEVLDAEMQAGLADCRLRTIVTAHDAFGHLARRYRLEQVGIAGVDPSGEPSPRRIEEIARLVKQKNVTTVFTETLVSPRVAEALAREAGVRTAVLDPIEAGDAGDSYASLMRENLRALQSALGCA